VSDFGKLNSFLETASLHRLGFTCRFKHPADNDQTQKYNFYFWSGQF